MQNCKTYDIKPYFGEVADTDINQNPKMLYHAVTNIQEYPQFFTPAYEFISKKFEQFDYNSSLVLDGVFQTIQSISDGQSFGHTEHIGFEGDPLDLEDTYIRNIAPFLLLTSAWFKNATKLTFAENESGLVIQELTKLFTKIAHSDDKEGLNFRSNFHTKVGATVECSDPSFVSSCIF